MRILQVTTTISRGGAENHLVDLIEGLSRAGGVEISCAYLKGNPYWKPRLGVLGVPVADLGMTFNGAPMPIARLRRLIREVEPDLIHAHGTHAEFYALAATRTLSKAPPLVVSRHEERIRFFRIPGFRAFDRMITRSAAGFIAISEAVRRADVRRRPEIAGKMAVIHYGYRSDNHRAARAAEIRNEWSLAPNDILLVTLARFAPEKSLDTLIRGFAELRRRPGLPTAKLALVGRGPLESELRALSRELGVEDAIIWPGFREDVADILEAADIFVLPSRYEGFGLVLLEAMAASRPIIASRVSAIPEIVVDRETGLLFDPGDWQSLADRLEQLAGDAQLRARMGRAGHDRLTTHFQLERMVDRTLELYRETVANGECGSELRGKSDRSGKAPSPSC